MDTNGFGFDDIPQVVEATKQVFGAVTQVAIAVSAFISAVGVLVAFIGRAWHAKATGNSMVAAVVAGSNTPAGLTQAVANNTAAITGGTTQIAKP